MIGARRAAAAGGGGVLGVGIGMAGLLAVQARLARRTIGDVTAEPPVADGRYLPAGAQREAVDAPTGTDDIRLVVLGDSAAAGLGASGPATTPSGLIAAGIAEATGRPVHVRCHAVVGAQTQDLPAQLALAGLVPTDQLPADRVDAVVLIVGANDVTHRVPASTAARQLEDVVATLTACAAVVVVGTCPDLGTVRPIPHPLRLVCRRWSRALAAAQGPAVARGGGVAVALGGVLGPEFDARPDAMFAADGFHPSDDGYRAAVGILLPPVLEGLGVEPGRARVMGDRLLNGALPRRLDPTPSDAGVTAGV